MAINSTKKFLAVDFGASNGKALMAGYDGKTLALKETYRFENRPVYAVGELYWDILRLYSELKNSLSNSILKYGKISSIGVDTWGIDFGLLDKNGKLLGNPVHYRDKRTETISSRLFEMISEKEIYSRTGVQVLEMNTIFQLYSMILSGSESLKNAEKILLIGDLLNYFLTGKKILEYTAATTTQLYDQQGERWDFKIFELIGLSPELFPEVLKPGILIDNIKDDIRTETGCGAIPVCLSAYDTSSEIASIPVLSEHLKSNWAYFCCGTWAMSGIVSNKPIIDPRGQEYGFGNEGGVEGKSHFLKNIVGLWIIQQCRKKWSEDSGSDLKWSDIVMQAENAGDSDIIIDVNDDIFNKEIFDMPGAIYRYCTETGQSAPESIGGYSRCAFQSLVIAYTLSIRQLEDITNKNIEVIYIVGGGSNNRLICQWTADSLGIPVVSVPLETTATGNILLQLTASGEVRNIGEAKDILAGSIKSKTYEPGDRSIWDIKLEKLNNILETRKAGFHG